MAISVNIVKRGRDVLVAACDAELLGKTIRLGSIDFHVRPEFYGGQILTVENALQEVQRGTNINLLGERIVGHAVKAGLVHPEAIVHVSGIPHTIAVKV